MEQIPHLMGDARAAETMADAVAPAMVSWSRLVFQSYRDDNWEVYLADGDGANQRRLTRGGAADINPQLNRGCTRIAFASERRGNYDIWTMDPDGAALMQLTTDGYDDVSPAWSPDGARIAFQSYRDGQAEIYLMNADGSGQTRLTWDGAYDGQPAWSPDGAQIAFASRRAAGSGIWIMSADSENQRLLAAQRYAQNPAWSPDGAQIAFDADSDSDEWNEVLLMDADGSNQRQMLDGGFATELSVRSWSADGRNIGFTRSLWIEYQGDWYWTDAFLEAWDNQSGSTTRLPGAGVDWNPAWSALDNTPPTSSMVALPAKSPAPFTVSWSGSDAGPAGFRSYDVQVRDGPGGAWADWMMGTSATTQQYWGIGSHAYFFRARARDNAGNVEVWPENYDAMTTVEALAPQTEVSPLPSYVKGTVSVHWDGVDRGGSGIRVYDVQVRDGPAGAWTDWQTATTATQVEFTGTAGHAYYFRSRGVDYAQNVEAWPPGDGDAVTAFYAWTLTNKVADNRGAPLGNVTLAAAPSPFTVVPDDGTGTYVAYFVEETATCSASWSKPGFTSLPATDLPGNADVRFDTVLPPGDNVVTNWGFEQALDGWTAGGELTPVITDTVQHTGKAAARLGPATPAFKPSVKISQGLTDSWDPQVAVDASGAVHVVWQSDGIYYAHRDPAGHWSAAENVADIWPGSFQPQIALDSLGNLHVVWRQNPEPPEVYHIWRDINGTWSAPQNISQTPGLYSWGPLLATDNVGGVHLVWQEFDQSTESGIWYARRGPASAWSAPQKVSGELACEYPASFVEDSGVVHSAWSCIVSDNREVFYARRSLDGLWTAPHNVSNNPGISYVPAVAAETGGRVHITWSDATEGKIDTLYASRSPDGTWSSTEMAAEGFGGDDYRPQLAVDASGTVHATASCAYVSRIPAGEWSEPICLGGSPHMIVDANGVVHMAFNRAPGVLYAKRYDDGTWSSADLIATMLYTSRPRMAVDPIGAARVVWTDSGPSRWDIFYWEKIVAGSGGDSLLTQAISIPVDAANPTLSLLYRLEGTPKEGTNWFDVQLQEGVNTTTIFSTASSIGAWRHRWFDLGAWKGKTAVLRFRVHQTAGQLPVWAYLDEITLGSAYPDTWIEKLGPAIVAPGSQLTYVLHYGNRGAMPADGARVTDTLPTGLQFLEGDPPPTATTPSQLVWEVGNLPPAGEPAVIVIKAAVKPEVAGYTKLTNAAAISGTASEVESENNTAHVSTLVAHRLYLPMISRE